VQHDDDGNGVGWHPHRHDYVESSASHVHDVLRDGVCAGWLIARSRGRGTGGESHDCDREREWTAKEDHG
jgi:hypothetical protein